MPVVQTPPPPPPKFEKPVVVQAPPAKQVNVPYVPVSNPTAVATLASNSSGRFYSPLVRNIALSEGISQAELDTIEGSGQDGRVTKADILNYLQNRGQATTQQQQQQQVVTQQRTEPVTQMKAVSSSDGGYEIIEMDRMRKLIAVHMVRSKHTSPHVTSFVEVDVTDMVMWREKIKGVFQKKYNEKITFTPIFIEAVVKTIRDYPMINVSVDGDNIIVKKNINIGMAAALPSGNLIVPVIHNADGFNLMGLTKKVNDLADRARNNKLRPEEIQDGTFTLTNVGTFGNVMGTPIISQPQVAILGIGTIEKRPKVVTGVDGEDTIAIRTCWRSKPSCSRRNTAWSSCIPEEKS